MTLVSIPRAAIRWEFLGGQPVQASDHEPSLKNSSESAITLKWRRRPFFTDLES